MSVRNSLLAILTVGPAYGFQLHTELSSRTAGRRTVNVGQIYGTLERLVTQGAVESAGATEDGLPLYQLTAAGRIEGLLWLHDTTSSVGDEWGDLVDRVLLASSLPGVDVHSLIAAYRRKWGAASATLPATGQDELAARAAEALAAAALAWLDEAEALVRLGDDFERGLSEERPRRGRRPAASAH